MPERTVAENIYLGIEPTRFGVLDRACMRAEARRLLRRLSSAIRPDVKVRDLSIVQQQIIEIAKALAIEARILVMDEPTKPTGVLELVDFAGSTTAMSDYVVKRQPRQVVLITELDG